jgi:hypothetical protein
VVSDTALRHTTLHLTLPRLRRFVRQDGRMVLRDVVTSRPKLAASPLWHVLRTIGRAPVYVKHHGIHTAHRLLSFQLSPSWIRHVCKGFWLTSKSFQTTYSRFLPGCRFKNYGWAIAAIWEPRFSSELKDPS